MGVIGATNTASNLWKTIWNLLGAHTGSWGTPDIGVTETAAKKATGGVTDDLTNAFTGSPVSGSGQVYGSNLLPTKKVGSASSTTYTRPSSSTTYNPTNETTTSDDGGGDSISAEQLAILKWFADLQAAQYEGSSLRTQGDNTFATLMDSAKNYRNRAGELFKNAGQEITNTASNILGGNARLGQSARTRAMNTARAGGYGDSSRMGAMNQVTGNLAGLQGQTLAKRGENEMANLTDYNSRQDQATSQESEASRLKDSLYTNASELERLGMNNATVDFGGYLNNIRNAYQTMAMMNPLNSSLLSQYTTDFGGLTDSLNSIIPTVTPTTTDATADATNLALPETTSYIALMDPLKKKLPNNMNYYGITR